MTAVVRVENLSKSYRLQNAAGRNSTLRDALVNTFKNRTKARKVDILWALRDVSFEVQEGETLGIIGHNGAGKSTLLKILSRITRPTSGFAEMRGRVGSLLEVGTGFHTELSGRENIFLSGAILGMQHREIERKFDEIVAFAEIERFLDTPVKHYSSGMFMRLAFSVAVHLEPEILLMDEVLAVGDTDFQHKCLDKMQEVMNEGRTILFVSHNISAITRLCRRAVALNRGQIVAEGEVQTVVNAYLNSSWGIKAEKVWKSSEEAPQNEVVRLDRVRVIDEAGNTSGSIEIHRRVGIEITYEVLEPGHFLIPNFHFFTSERYQLFAVQDVAGEWRGRARERGVYTTTAWLPGNFFNEGSLIVDIAISSHVPETRVHLRSGEAVRFEIVDIPQNNYTRGDFTGSFPGLIRPLAEWETEVRNKFDG